MTRTRAVAEPSYLLERDGTVARFAMREYICLRSCLRESLTEGWPHGSKRWLDGAALFHALPTASSRAATWAPESGLTALKGRGRWAPVEALAMFTWALPIYWDAVQVAQSQPWAGEEWLPRLTASPRDVARLEHRLNILGRTAGHTRVKVPSAQ